MTETTPWVVTALMTLLALLGLVLASQATDGGFALFGWALMIFGLAMIIGVHSRAGASSRGDRP